MSNNKEKLAAVNRLLAHVDGALPPWVEKLKIILEEPDLTEVNVESNGYGTIQINGDTSAVIPFERLREVNRLAADNCQAAAQKSLVKKAKLQIGA